MRCQKVLVLLSDRGSDKSPLSFGLNEGLE